jgi:hypothetical protein
MGRLYSPRGAPRAPGQPVLMRARGPTTPGALSAAGRRQPSGPPPAQAFPLRRRPDSAHRSGLVPSIRVRLTRGNRRSAPHRLWPRTGVADASCHSGTKGAVDSRPLPMAPLCLGSSWRSATERLGASSMGLDLARYRHYPSRTGGCAYRRGLAGGCPSAFLPAPDPGPCLEGASSALGLGRRGDAPQRRVSLSVV